GAGAQAGRALGRACAEEGRACPRGAAQRRIRAPGGPQGARRPTRLSAQSESACPPGAGQCLAMSTRILDWLYGKLGRWYPIVYLPVELQSAFIIMAATLGLFSFYYDAVREDYVALFAIAATLTAISMTFLLKRAYRPMTAVS